MEALAALQERLRNHDGRIQANHDSIGHLRSVSARHETKIQVITTELRETREDIGEIRKDLAKARTEQRDEMAWVRRGLWAAAGTFMMFFVAAASLLIQIGGS